MFLSPPSISCPIRKALYLNIFALYLTFKSFWLTRLSNIFNNISVLYFVDEVVNGYGFVIYFVTKNIVMKK